MVVKTFAVDSKIVEVDTTRQLEPAEISDYSIRHYIQSRLEAWNWNVNVSSMNDGWPDYDTLAPPAVIVELRENTVAGVELGSHGSRNFVVVHVVGQNHAQRVRLAELVKKIIRDTIPIFNYVTGNEPNPDPTGEYFVTDDVGWQPIPTAYTAPDAQHWRADVTATLRRVE